MPNYYGPRIVTDNLVMCVDAANPKSYSGSGTVWNDLSGNGNHVNLVNGPTFSSENRGCFIFDGTNDYGATSSAPTLNMGGKSFTGEVWIKVTNFSGSERMVFEYSVWSSTNVYQLSLIGGNNIRVNFVNSNSAGKWLDYAYTPLTTNIWLHIVGQFDTVNNNFNLYINGSSVGQVTAVTQEISSATSALYIGSRGGSQLFLACTIGALKMYDRALSATEILQNYNATKGRFKL
jgi:hypothetical protein